MVRIPVQMFQSELEKFFLDPRNVVEATYIGGKLSHITVNVDKHPRLISSTSTEQVRYKGIPNAALYNRLQKKRFSTA